MNYSLLEVSQSPQGLLTVTLNRPEKLNALNQGVLLELIHCFTQAKQDPAVKAVLITGKGEKAFCAGADIQQLTQINGQQGLAFAELGQQVFSLLENLGKPSIAAVNGYAFGGGCELAMSATLRIAASTALFSQPEVKLGLIPGYGGTQRLARLVGKGRAMELCLTGRTFSAENALNWGLITEVVESQQLFSRANEIAAELLNQAPFALKAIMTVINTGYDLPLKEALDLEAAYFGLCCATDDKEEGVSAFLEKRKAAFKGQ